MKQLKAYLQPRTDFKLSALQKELKGTLTAHEKVEKAYLLPQHTFVFTDKRLIVGDPAGFAEVQFPCLTIPYRSMTRFSLTAHPEMAGSLQLSLWLQGDADPLQFPLLESPAAQELHRALADYALNRYSPWQSQQLMWKKEAGLRTLRNLGLTGAALVAAACALKKHRKEKNALKDALGSSAVKAMILKKLKG